VQVIVFVMTIDIWCQITENITSLPLCVKIHDDKYLHRATVNDSSLFMMVLNFSTVFNSTYLIAARIWTSIQYKSSSFLFRWFSLRIFGAMTPQHCHYHCTEPLLEIPLAEIDSCTCIYLFWQVSYFCTTTTRLYFVCLYIDIMI